MEQQDLITLTADIVSAHVSNNSVAISDVPTLVQRVHEALSGLGQAGEEAVEEKREPAVSVRSSVKPDSITCLVCGKKQKTLRRHLQVNHGLTPSEYKAEFGLPDSYPLTAPNYSERRREMAKTIGLGRKKGESPKAAAKGTGGGKAKAVSSGRGRRKASASNEGEQNNGPQGS